MQWIKCFWYSLPDFIWWTGTLNYFIISYFLNCCQEPDSLYAAGAVPIYTSSGVYLITFLKRHEWAVHEKECEVVNMNFACGDLVPWFEDVTMLQLYSQWG